VSTANSSQARKEGKRRAGKKKKVVIIILILIILILIGVILFLLLRKPEEERRNVVITPENVERVLEELGETAEAGYYTVTMNPTWHFKVGNEVSEDAVVENVETNTNDVYFDIVLAEDEEKVIYKSPIIPRGGRLEDIAFEEELEEGIYDCVVIYHLIDDEQNTLSTLRVTLQIVVEG
jgi:hypothetical protein